ncbi:isochorismatase family protein [Achromobacter sp. AGC39]
MASCQSIRSAIPSGPGSCARDADRAASLLRPEDSVFRKQLIIAGLWTEVCVAMPAIQAAGEGWDVTVVTDASGGVSVEAHEVALQRMAVAGVNLMTWLAVAAEWQRDWARLGTAEALTNVLVQHAAGAGIAHLWEQQLLNTPAPATAS